MKLAETTQVFTRLTKKRMSIARRKNRAQRNFLVEPEQATLTVTDGNAQSGRAKKLDGAFFEEYANLNEKQEELIEEAAKGTLRREAQQVVPDSYHGRIFVSPEKKKSLELYKELVYTIMYRLGKKKQGGDSLTDGEIYSYGREVLDINSIEHKDVYEDVKAMKPPECYLNLKVIAGTELDPKDANGLSDPYCMMCLINNGEGDKISDNGNKRKKKLLRQFKNENDVKLTKIKLKTLNPEWNQHFKFVVHDIQNQVLRLDMWDKDDNTVVLDADNTITSIKGFRGAGRFFKEIVQSAKSGKDTLDDFMGLLEIPLRNIPENGLDAWFQLEPRSKKKKVGGKIHLKLTFSSKMTSRYTSVTNAQNPDQLSSNISSFHSSNEVYQEFVTNFVRYDCQKANDIEPGVCWDCCLVDKAESVLLQFEMQHEITRLEQTVIKWKAYSKLFEDAQIPLDFINKLLEDYQKYSIGDEIESKEEVEEFLLSLTRFVDYSLRLLHKYRYLFSAADTQKCLQLGKLLMSLLIIYKIPIFKTRFPDRWLNKEINEAVEKSTAEWFSVMVAHHQAIENSPYDVLHELVGLTNTMNADLKRGETTYKPIFDIVRVPYLMIVFNKVELLISDIIENSTKGLEKKVISRKTADDDDTGTAMFELYLAVRNLYGLKQSLPKEDRNVGGIDHYSDWFKRGVVKWLDIASEKAKARIKKAVQLDEVRVIDAMVKHSTSAVDVSCCLGQICIFWNRLDWPDASGAFMFLTKITEIVGDCAREYGEMVLQQLRAKGFYDDIGQFDVTDQLCIMMNNLSHVLQFLDYVPQALDYEKVLSNMAVVHGESRLPQLKTTLEKILTCAKDDVHNRLEKIMDHVGERMKDSLNGYLIKIVSQHSKDVASVVDPLLEYIDSNLVTLNAALLSQVFDRVLLHFWETFVSTLHDLVLKNRKKLLQSHYFKISEIFEIVRDFFHGDGDGLSLEQLSASSYQDMNSILLLNKATTEELIERFYMDRCEEQKGADSKLGVLTFKAFYCNQTRKLNVYVMNCKNLLPMDKTGASDPYVTLQLLPNHVFGHAKLKKTKVEKNTLFPLFDESFQFEIPPPDCLKDGATLLFTVYDQDRLSDDDLAGEVYYDLQNITGLTSETVEGSFATVPQIEMPLMIGALKSETIKVLKSRRPQDQLAAQFVTKHKQRLKEMNENLQKALEQLARQPSS